MEEVLKVQCHRKSTSLSKFGSHVHLHSTVFKSYVDIAVQSNSLSK